mgnify:CR=1 FL=1
MNENIVLDPAERAYTDFLTQRNDLIEDTKRAIKVQWRKTGCRIARLSDWSTYQKYETLAVARESLSAAQRKHGPTWEFRIDPAHPNT